MLRAEPDKPATEPLVWPLLRAYVGTDRALGALQLRGQLRNGQELVFAHAATFKAATFTPRQIPVTPPRRVRL